MPRRSIVDLPLARQLEIVTKSGLRPMRRKDGDEMTESLNDRISSILGVLNKSERNGCMIFFVMYDIENNKVRRYIVKYLERAGCHRVQKSIFLADLPYEKYNEIKADLTAVQSFYENNDSILIAPLPMDYVQSMSVIGQNIDMDLILKNKNTLFF